MDRSVAVEAVREPSRYRTGTHIQSLRVEVVSNERSFLQLEPVWNALVEEAAIDHPFLRHEWVRTWWECFGEGKELHIVLVKAGEEVIAIAPFMRSRGRMCGVPVRLLEFISNGYVERFDVIIARRPEEACRAMWRHLVSQKTRWDVLRLCQLPAGSRTLEAVPGMARGEGFLTGIWRSSDSPYIEFADGWDGYVKRLSGNQRQQTMKKLKRLGHRGKVELEMVFAGEHLRSALRDGFRLEAADWKHRSGTAIACRPELQRFLTQLADIASQNGMLRLLFLKVGDVRIAFAYALCYKNKLFVLKAGYDPRYADYSPYHLLCYLVFRDACERGLAAYEFLGNNEAWKLHWTKQTRSHYWVYAFSPSLRTRLLHAVKFRLIPSLQGLGFYLLARKAAIKLTRPHAI